MKGRKEEEGTMAGEPFEGDESKKAESPAAAAATLEEKTKATSSEATRAATPSSTAAAREEAAPTGEGTGGESSEATRAATPSSSAAAGEAAATGEGAGAGAGGEAKAPLGDEEDTGAQIAPIVRLEEVVISSGEENEDVLLDLKSKLYRFDKKDGNQWKERGVGQVKLLQHKETKKVRLLMRQSKTLKICANHLVLPSMNLQEHAGNEKSWVWHATDFSEGELKNELLCIRLGSVENAQKFKSAFEEAQDKTGKAELERPDVKEADDDAVKALGGLSLGEKPNKESTEQPAVESSA